MSVCVNDYLDNMLDTTTKKQKTNWISSSAALKDNVNLMNPESECNIS